MSEPIDSKMNEATRNDSSREQAVLPNSSKARLAASRREFFKKVLITTGFVVPAVRVFAAELQANPQDVITGPGSGMGMGMTIRSAATPAADDNEDQGSQIQPFAAPEQNSTPRQPVHSHRQEAAKQKPIECSIRSSQQSSQKRRR